MIFINTGQGRHGRYLKNSSVSGNRIMEASEGAFFDVNTATFPMPVTDASYANVHLTFSAQVSVIVDFGDGTITTYISQPDPFLPNTFHWGLYQNGATNTEQPGVGMYPHHTFTPPLGHTLSILYPAAALIAIELNSFVLPVQDFAFGFAQHARIRSFGLRNVLSIAGPVTSTPATFLSLDLDNIQYCTALIALTLARCFHTTSIWYGAIPTPLLSRPLQLLNIGDEGFEQPGQTFATTNLDKIVNAAATLVDLTINYAMVDNNPDPLDPGPLPANFVQLIRLLSLECNGTDFTRVPDLINQMGVDPAISTDSQLLKLSLRNSPDINLWSNNLTGLTRAITMNFSNCQDIPASVPPWLHVTNPVVLDFARSFRTTRPNPQDIDDFIASLYAVVEVEADKTGLSPRWRGVTLDIGEQAGTTNTQTPSGTFQMPSGYNPGTNNGAPASAMERLWVLENQYNWEVNANGVP